MSWREIFFVSSHLILKCINPAVIMTRVSANIAYMFTCSTSVIILTVALVLISLTRWGFVLWNYKILLLFLPVTSVLSVFMFFYFTTTTSAVSSSEIPCLGRLIWRRKYMLSLLQSRLGIKLCLKLTH